MHKLTQWGFLIGIGSLVGACGDDESSPSTATLDGGDGTATLQPSSSGTGSTEGSEANSSSEVSDAATFVLVSPNFEPGDPLPDEYTCEGKEFGAGYSPELNWHGAPAGTKSYALVFKDESLLSSLPQRAYHWAAWNIPLSVDGIPEQLGVGQFPEALMGGEQFRAGPPHEIEFFGPCPSWDTLCSGAPRSNDSYTFTLYAFAEAELTAPDRPEEGNYVLELNAFFASRALAKTELRATSDASPTSAPMCPADAGADGGADGGIDGGSDDGGFLSSEPIDGGSDAASAGDGG